MESEKLNIYKITFKLTHSKEPVQYLPKCVYITALSEKQSLKYFFDWVNKRLCSEVIILQTDVLYSRSKEFKEALEGWTIEERLKRQNDFIYKGIKPVRKREVKQCKRERK